MQKNTKQKSAVVRRKILSLLLSLAMILTALPLAGVTTFAEGETHTSGDFEYTVLEDGTAEITGYTGSAETLEIPSKLDTYTVTSIGDYAFEDCDSLTSVTIPDSVESIGVDAFSNCKRLTNITIPKSVISIGEWAFDNTGYSNDLSNWKNGVLYIGDCLLNSYVDVVPEDYTINEGTRVIADYAFSECYQLKRISIPESVEIIGNWTFAYCYNLTSVTISESITSIGALAFWGCSSLTDIIVDENNKNYSSQDGVLFNKNKTELMQCPSGNARTSYDIPDGVTNINDSAFCSCSKLTSITIPNSVTSIGAGAFEECIKLTSITIGNGVTSIGGESFKSCSNLKSITVPESVVSIGAWAFSYCDDLVNIYILNKNCDLCEYAIEQEITIHGYAGSTAEEYANKYGNKFVVIEGDPANPDAPVPSGDVNVDGNLSTVDAKWILQNIAGSRDFTEAQFKAADLNGDGKVTTVDAKWVLQAVAGMRTV